MATELWLETLPDKKREEMETLGEAEWEIMHAVSTAMRYLKQQNPVLRALYEKRVLRSIKKGMARHLALRKAILQSLPADIQPEAKAWVLERGKNGSNYGSTISADYRVLRRELADVGLKVAALALDELTLTAGSHYVMIQALPVGYGATLLGNLSRRMPSIDDDIHPYVTVIESLALSIMSLERLIASYASMNLIKAKAADLQEQFMVHRAALRKLNVSSPKRGVGESRRAAQQTLLSMVDDAIKVLAKLRKVTG